MARIMKQSKQRGEGSTKMQSSEVIIFIAVAVVLLAGLRYYFFVYRASAGFTLGTFMNAVGHGDLEAQYDMLFQNDKDRWWPTKDAYEKSNEVPLAHGYSARITNLRIREQPHPDKPGEAIVDVDIDLRGAGTGKLTESAAGTSVKDTYFMKKDSEGKWKVWLGNPKTKLKILTVKPNDKSSF